MCVLDKNRIMYPKCHACIVASVYYMMVVKRLMRWGDGHNTHQQTAPALALKQTTNDVDDEVIVLIRFLQIPHAIYEHWRFAANFINTPILRIYVEYSIIPHHIHNSQNIIYIFYTWYGIQNVHNVRSWCSLDYDEVSSHTHSQRVEMEMPHSAPSSKQICCAHVVHTKVSPTTKNARENVQFNCFINVSCKSVCMAL